MKVSDVMTATVASCAPETTMVTVTEMMSKNDCGFIPVINEKGELLGVVTDRDVCLALGRRNVPASTVHARDVMSQQVIGCAPEDDCLRVLHTMKEHRIRRLPVEGIGGVLLGVISLNDVTLAVARTPVGHPLRNALVDVLAGICRHQHASHVARA